MSSTNKTSDLELSQFIGTDSPKWLTDYNADMQKIDAGVAAVQSQADATDIVVSGHTSSISTLQDTTTSQGTTITQLRTDVSGNTGSINTINSLIGNGEPTTTDKTIIGAINELNNSKAAISRGVIQVTPDGIKSYGDLFNEVISQLNDLISGLGASAKIIYRSVDIVGFANLICEGQYFYGNVATLWAQNTMLSVGGNIRFNRITISNGANEFLTGVIANDGTVSAPINTISAVPTNGDTITVHYEIYSE